MRDRVWKRSKLHSYLKGVLKTGASPDRRERGDDDNEMENPQRFDDPAIYKRPSSWSPRRLTDMVPGRVVLYLLSFSGFLVSFMMRMDINLAIIAMAKTETNVNDTKSTSINQKSHCYLPNNVSFADKNGDNDNDKDLDGEYDWSPSIQSMIVGSFYWCYILSQIVGGVLTQYFGMKTVFGVSQLATAICSLLIPTAADIHYGAMIALRSIQGAASGLTWPAMYAAVGPWIPPTERSRFMSSFQGFSIGIGLTYPLCGFIIKHFGWRTVFYTTGSIGTGWCVLWYFLAFDTPASHPRITHQERRYIEGCVGEQVVLGSEGMPVPWKDILTSWPAWSIGITTFGRIWVHYVFIIQGPMYMKSILGFDIQTNGILNGLPFICSYVASVLFCYLADILVTRQIMSLLNVRKICTALAQVVPGILLILIGYLGCNTILVLVVWFIAVTLITAAYAGAMANIVDIAPNLAGPVLAFAQTIHMSASFLSPIFCGMLIDQTQSLDTWRQVFMLAACIACSTYVIYQIFGTADIQAWNYPDKKYPQSIAEDSQPLKESPNKNGKIIPSSRGIPESSQIQA